jgi:hypothetical protein
MEPREKRQEKRIQGEEHPVHDKDEEGKGREDTPMFLSFLCVFCFWFSSSVRRSFETGKKGRVKEADKREIIEKQNSVTNEGDTWKVASAEENRKSI